MGMMGGGWHPSPNVLTSFFLPICGFRFIILHIFYFYLCSPFGSWSRVWSPIYTWALDPLRYRVPSPCHRGPPHGGVHTPRPPGRRVTTQPWSGGGWPEHRWRCSRTRASRGTGRRAADTAHISPGGEGSRAAIFGSKTVAPALGSPGMYNWCFSDDNNHNTMSCPCTYTHSTGKLSTRTSVLYCGERTPWNQISHQWRELFPCRRLPRHMLTDLNPRIGRQLSVRSTWCVQKTPKSRYIIKGEHRKPR